MRVSERLRHGPSYQRRIGAAPSFWLEAGRGEVAARLEPPVLYTWAEERRGRRFRIVDSGEGARGEDYST